MIICSQKFKAAFENKTGLICKRFNSALFKRKQSNYQKNNSNSYISIKKEILNIADEDIMKKIESQMRLLQSKISEYNISEEFYIKFRIDDSLKLNY